MAWAVKRPAAGRNALRNRTAAIREFARYLTRLGEQNNVAIQRNFVVVQFQKHE